MVLSDANFHACFKLWLISKAGIEDHYFGNEINPNTPAVGEGQEDTIQFEPFTGYRDCMEYERIHRDSYQVAILYMRRTTGWEELAYFKDGFLLRHQGIHFSTAVRHGLVAMIRGKLVLIHFKGDKNRKLDF